VRPSREALRTVFFLRRRQRRAHRVAGGDFGSVQTSEGVPKASQHVITRYDYASLVLPMIFPMAFGLFFRRTPGWSGWTTVIIGFLCSFLVKCVPPESFARLFGWRQSLNPEEKTYFLFFATVCFDTVMCTAWFFST
jgi:hypothetical protein